jgi:hypothetical protein
MKIRLEEITWGGVIKDGIPSLDNPDLTGAAPFVFGSSGFLYRSNKLMFDRETNSLWNQFTGKPVVGPLADSGIELRQRPVVITTGRDWVAGNPDTRVLALNTGHRRNYGSGVVYSDYFASNDLMFPVLVDQSTYQQKSYVFGIRVMGAAKAWPLKYFAQNPVINDQVAGLPVVLIGNAKTRTVRAYERGEHEFSLDGEVLRAAGGGVWVLGETACRGMASRWPACRGISRIGSPGTTIWGRSPRFTAHEPPLTAGTERALSVAAYCARANGGQAARLFTSILVVHYTPWVYCARLRADARLQSEETCQNRNPGKQKARLRAKKSNTAPISGGPAGAPILLSAGWRWWWFWVRLLISGGIRRRQTGNLTIWSLRWRRKVRARWSRYARLSHKAARIWRWAKARLTWKYFQLRAIIRRPR